LTLRKFFLATFAFAQNTLQSFHTLTKAGIAKFERSDAWVFALQFCSKRN